MKTALILSFLMFAGVSHGDVVNKETAPDFKLKDMKGKEHKLSDFKGKWVVLEWFNKDCPFVVKHYGSNNMQKLQKTYTEKGVVWLTMYSTDKSVSGFETGVAAVKTQENYKGSASYLMDDNEGIVGRQYGAKTTPHMFIISPEQKVVYQGAIDDRPSTDAADIAKSKNYVSMALDQALAGKEVTAANTRSYGCSVKYK